MLETLLGERKAKAFCCWGFVFLKFFVVFCFWDFFEGEIEQSCSEYSSHTVDSSWLKDLTRSSGFTEGAADKAAKKTH